MSELNERLQKLYRLAEQGVGGEKENAQVMLERLLEKNGMCMADLEKEEEEEVLFRWDSKIEQSLLFQVIYSVKGDKKLSFFRRKKDPRHSLRFMTSRSARAEISLTFAVLKQHLAQEMQVFYSAFVHKHRLFPKNNKPLEKSELSEKELMKALRVRQMAESINQAQIHKQIEKK